MTPTVSIIIPTKNEEANIARCIQSVKDTQNTCEVAGWSETKAMTPRRWRETVEILVIDNYSTDKTASIAKKLGARVFQKGPERSTQKNFGAKKAKGKYLFFVDADMEVDQAVIGQTIAIFEKKRKDTPASGPDVTSGTLPEWNVKASVVPEISVGENYWARVRALERNCYLGEPTIEAARIFEKKTFIKAGGFDEELIAAEDWDLHQRVQKLGQIGRVKAKIIHHEGKLSLIDHLRKKYYYAKNIKLYAQKHPEKFLAQSDWGRIQIFLKNWRQLIADPFHTLGLFILKSLEYLVYLLSFPSILMKTLRTKSP